MTPSERFSSLTDGDINFFEKVNTDLCDLQKKHLGTVLSTLGTSC